MKIRIHLINDSFVLEHVEGISLKAVFPDLSCNVEVKCYGNEPVVHKRVMGVDILALWEM